MIGDLADWPLIAAIAATGVGLGIAIGAVGIGGVLLVPFLTLTLGIDVKHAIAAAMVSYLPSCVVARHAVRPPRLHPVARGRGYCARALPTAWLGAHAARHAPAHAGSSHRHPAAGRRHLRIGARAQQASARLELGTGNPAGLGGGTGFSPH